MEYSLTQHDVYYVHEEMSLAWSIDPRRDVQEDTEGWTSDERPPWDPIWNDFMVEIPYYMHIPVYQLLFPGSDPPSFPEMRSIPLTTQHIKRIKEIADTMEEQPSTDIDTENESEMAVLGGLDEPAENELDRMIETIQDRMIETIHHLEPRVLFQEDDEEDEARERRVVDCRRGFSIIEESVNSGTCLSEGQYLELANIFKRLSG